MLLTMASTNVNPTFKKCFVTKSNKLICESHVVLGSIVDHIVPLHQVKKNRFHIVSFEDIIDVCMYMKFSDGEVGYAAHFPNHFEKDCMNIVTFNK